MTDYLDLLREIAVPRLAGSLSQARMMEPLKRELTGRGFTVAEQRFRASPAARNAVAFLGLVVAGMGAAVLVLGALRPDADRTAWVLFGVALAALVLGTPVRGPFLERWGGRPAEAINLVATRAGPGPKVWLAAHYDSKGQVFSMATRLLLVACAAAGAAALIVVAALARAGVPPAPAVWTTAALLAVAGGGPLTLNPLLRHSPGAVDNATGIVTVLGVLDRLEPDAPIGVLLPDAEEWGLLGARALARGPAELLRDAAVVSFDGIDDRGPTVAFVHRPGPVVTAVVRALGARPARWLPVLVDGILLGRAARECVTILRGGWRTMRVVHTPRDTAERLRLVGVAEVAEGVASALRRA